MDGDDDSACGCATPPLPGVRARPRTRGRLTPSEEVLWQALRGRKLGVEFRRQVVLCARCIADFFAAVRITGFQSISFAFMFSSLLDCARRRTSVIGSALDEPSI
jgi:hypothetical protein